MSNVLVMLLNNHRRLRVWSALAKLNLDEPRVEREKSKQKYTTIYQTSKISLHYIIAINFALVLLEINLVGAKELQLDFAVLFISKALIINLSLEANRWGESAQNDAYNLPIFVIAASGEDRY